MKPGYEEKKLNEDMLYVIEENNEFIKSANYIIEKFKVNLEFKELKKIGRYLIQDKKYSLEQIIKGEADGDIKEILYVKGIINGSVILKEEVKYEPIVIKQKSNMLKTFALAFTMTAAMATTFKVIDFKFNSYAQNKNGYEVSQDLTELAGYSDGNIVRNHKYYTGRDTQTGEYMFAYKNDEIAKDLINICKQDPELFDVSLASVYFNLENRLKNMDEIIQWMRIELRKSGELEHIFNKLDNYNDFIDYLLDIGLVEANTDEYNKIVNANKEYKTVDSYYKLSKDNQKVIEDLISKYKDKKKVLDDLYSIRLNNMVENNNEVGRSK